MNPHWDLSEVKALAADHDGLWLGKQHARDSFRTYGEAYKTARKVIANLTMDRFAKTVTFPGNPNVMDVFGVAVRGANWYLKLYIADDEDGPGGKQVHVSSLHPLERDLKTNGGTMKA